MATVSNQSDLFLGNWHHRSEHPVWLRTFTEREQLRLVEEDLSAGRSVATVLVAVVTTGFLLIAGTVALTLL